MASSSWPLDRRNLARERSSKEQQSIWIRTKSNKQNTYLGDSWKLKTANRMRKTKSVTEMFEETEVRDRPCVRRQIGKINSLQPKVIIKYRHPILSFFSQQGVCPELQAGRAVSQEYLGTSPQAIKEETTTPRGWKVDSHASRKRRLLGRNSRVIVASIGLRMC
jgi:hypothetical protein